MLQHWYFYVCHARACLTRLKENKGTGDIEGVYLQVFSLLIRVYLLISFYRGSHKADDLDMGSSDLASSDDQYGQCSQFGLFSDNGISLNDGVCLGGEDANQMTCCM